jgi:hypothetical protein
MGVDFVGDPRITDPFRALAYVGTVKAVRAEYVVCRTAAGDFAVFSPSNRSPSSYHLTIVSRERAESLRRVLPEDGMTSSSALRNEVVKGKFAGDKATQRFEVLMAFYVLVATGSVEMRRAGRSLLFRPK